MIQDGKKYDGGYIELYPIDCLYGLREIETNSVDLIFRDLPYGITKMFWDHRISLEPLWQQYLRIGKPSCVFIFTSVQPFTTDLINSARGIFRSALVWDKGRGNDPGNAKVHPLKRHEDVLVFCRQKTVYNPQMTSCDPYTRVDRSPPNKEGGQNLLSGITIKGEKHTRYYTEKFPTSILSFPNPNGKNLKINSTQKPLQLLEWLIRTYTDEGMLVVDPTFGSGTTAIACINTKRHCIGFEKDREMFEKACERIEQCLKME